PASPRLHSGRQGRSTQPRARARCSLRRPGDRQEAHLIAAACTSPCEGRDRWPLRLLAGRMVEPCVVDSLPYEAVRRTPEEGQLDALAEEAVVRGQGRGRSCLAHGGCPGPLHRTL